jgi:squalene synthase HpnC
MPHRVRQHVCNIYAYCRWADDLADETGDPQKSITLLRWWEQQLRECYAGRTQHPVFIALQETVEKFHIPLDPFLDLLVAFRQDQRVKRYETTPQVLEYCRYSANPVGRLMLYLGECFEPYRARLADAVCTGLQLANFCQDVAGDWQRGRIYFPLSECSRFKYEESMFADHECNEAFRQLMASQVLEAEGWLKRGQPLIPLAPEWMQLPVALFIHGGLAILAAIRQQNYDVWSSRPTVNRRTKLRLAVRCWWRLRRGTLLESEA